MKPSEFTAFEESFPVKNKHIIVTNNINGTNAHGEMSHVWLASYVIKSQQEWEGLIVFDKSDRKIIRLTHWKYV